MAPSGAAQAGNEAAAREEVIKRRRLVVFMAKQIRGLYASLCAMHRNEKAKR